MKYIFEFNAKIWKRMNQTKNGSWHFITLPIEIGEQIKKIPIKKEKKGRRSIKVKVRIGFITWETSIFPDMKRGSYLLPIKSEIRTKLQIKENDNLFINLSIINEGE